MSQRVLCVNKIILDNHKKRTLILLTRVKPYAFKVVRIWGVLLNQMSLKYPNNKKMLHFN